MSLAKCLRKLGGGKSAEAFSAEERQEIKQQVAEYAKTMDRTAAEHKAVQEILEQARNERDYIESVIRKAMGEAKPKAKTTQVKQKPQGTNLAADLAAAQPEPAKKSRGAYDVTPEVGEPGSGGLETAALPFRMTLSEAVDRGFNAGEWWKDLAWIKKHPEHEHSILARTDERGLTEKFTDEQLDEAKQRATKYEGEQKIIKQMRAVKEQRSALLDKIDAAKDDKEEAALMREYEQLGREVANLRNERLKYSEVPQPESPIPASELTTNIKAQFRAVPLFDKIVKVYETQAEATAAGTLSENAGRVAGFTTKDGKIGIIAENIQKGRELGIFLHEAGVHLGMERLVGKENMAWLHDRVHEWAKKDDGSVESKAAKAALDRAEKSKTDNNAEGRIAYMVEELVNRGVEPKATTPGGTWMQRLVGFARVALAKLGLKAESFSGQNLVDLAYGAAHMELKSETGGPRQLEMKYSEVKKAPKEPEAGVPTLGPLRRTGEGVSIKNLYPSPEEAPTWKEAINQSLAAAGKGDIKGITSPVVRQALGLEGNRLGLLDYIKNKFISNAASWQGKSDEALGAAMVSAKTGKVTGVSLTALAKNANQLVESYLKSGRMALDKQGVPHVVEDKVNHDAFIAADRDLQKILLDRTSGDKNAANSMRYTLYYLPRDEVMAKVGKMTPEQTERMVPAKVKAEREALLRDDKVVAEAYKKAKDVYDEIQKRAIDFDEATGRISAEEAAKYRQRPEYWAMYRQMEELGEVKADAQFMTSLLQGKYAHHIEANIRAPGDPVDNLIRNSMWRTKAALNTLAARRVADDMMAVGAADKAYAGMKGRPDVVEYLRDGKLSYLRVHDMNDLSIFAASPVVGGHVMSIFRAASNFLRLGVTLTPIFAIRQLPQDAIHSMLVNPHVKFWEAMRIGAEELWKNSVGETETAKTLRRYGVSGQPDYVDNTARWLKEFETHQRGPWRNIIEKLHQVANASDIAARAMVFKQEIARGATEAEAAHAARMTMNFNDKGSSRSLAMLMTMVPFLNPRIQGNYRLVRALQGKVPGMSPKQAQAAALMKISQIATFTALYSLLNSGDPDYEESLNDEEKMANWLFSIPGVAPIRVPISPEVLPVKLAVESAVRTAIGVAQQDAGKNWDAVKYAISSEFFGLGADFIPIAVKPAIELPFNINIHTGKPLVGKHLQNLDPFMQFTESTSEMSKAAAANLHSIGIEWSPIKIDQAMRGILGTTAIETARLTNDAIAAARGTEHPAMRPNQIPVIGGVFASERPGIQLRSDFTDLANDIMTKKQTYADLLQNAPSQANEYLKENQKLIQAASWATGVREQLSTMDKQRKQALAAGRDDLVRDIEQRQLSILRNAKVQEHRNELM